MASFVNPLWRDLGSSAPAFPKLSRSVSADLCVIGGGFLGLSAALAASERGRAVIVVEAGRIGDRASGLNGGQVIPGLKYNPSEIVAHYGERVGRPLVDFVGRAADSVFDLIGRHAMPVAHTRTGWIQAAHTEAAAATAAARAGEWRREGADVSVLDAAEVSALTGATGYVGGWIDRRAGVIDPLAFTRGLAGAATGAGAVIAEETAATALRREGSLWRVTLATGGAVTAPMVLVATNAYSDRLVPGLAASVVPVHSFQVATPPLTGRAAQTILAAGQAVSDMPRVLSYFRRSPDGRLVFGGRGSLSEPSGIGDWGTVAATMARRFPAVAGLPITHRWFGRVGITLDHLPHLHEPEAGLFAMVGCQGRGVALQTALGERFGVLAQTGERAALPFPLTPVRPIAFHGFRRIGLAAAVSWYRALDALDMMRAGRGNPSAAAQ